MGISVEDFHLNLFVFLSVYSWMLSFEHVFISIAQLKPKKTFTSIGHHPSDFCDQILLHESQILEEKIYVREFFISESEVEGDLGGEDWKKCVVNV
jgi:hypothetical protein